MSNTNILHSIKTMKYDRIIQDKAVVNSLRPLN